jgi:hypothetical protein
MLEGRLQIYLLQHGPGGGDPIPVAARRGATVAPRGPDHGLRGPRDESGFVGGG